MVPTGKVDYDQAIIDFTNLINNNHNDVVAYVKRAMRTRRNLYKKVERK